MSVFLRRSIKQERSNKAVRMIQLKRAYEPADPADGARFLVERLWPRGIQKAALAINAWMKDIAPSTELRQWFHTDSARWPAFRERYLAELASNIAAAKPLLDAAHNGVVTLVYAAHDPEHNSAVVLKEFLERHPASKKQRSAPARAR
jgi:uncharacterized protein YeaO (DUF488 family)